MALGVNFSGSWQVSKHPRPRISESNSRISPLQHSGYMGSHKLGEATWPCQGHKAVSTRRWPPLSSNQSKSLGGNVSPQCSHGNPRTQTDETFSRKHLYRRWMEEQTREREVKEMVILDECGSGTFLVETTVYYDIPRVVFLAQST